jgi:hypothetical protein
MRNRSGWTKRLILHQWQGKKAKPGGDRAPSLPIDAGAAVPTMRDTRSCIGTCRVAIHEKCNISIENTKRADCPGKARPADPACHQINQNLGITVSSAIDLQ